MQHAVRTPTPSPRTSTADLRIHNVDRRTHAITVRIFDDEQVVHYDRIYVDGHERHVDDDVLEPGTYVVEIDADTGSYDRTELAIDDGASVAVEYGRGVVRVGTRRDE